MLTEDYLMRLLRLATAAIAQALGLRAAKLYTDAIYVLDQMLQQLLGLNIELINQMDDNSLLASLWKQDGPDLVRMQIAANLIKEEADIFSEQGLPEESHWRYLRALTLYLNVVLYDGAEKMPLPIEPIEDILELIPLSSLSLDVKLLLFYCFDKIGNVVEADRYLTLVLNDPGAGSDFADEAMAFYNRILIKTDDELNRIGMSREAIEEKAKPFRSQ